MIDVKKLCVIVNYFSLSKQEEIQSAKLDAEFGQCSICCVHSIVHAVI